MLPRNVFMALNCLLLFTQNLLLLHQQLVIVLVARVRLLWILEIQLRRRRHRRRFHPHWLFPHSAESWFEILLRFIPRFTEAINNVPRESTRGKSYGHVLFVIHMLQNLMTNDGWMSRNKGFSRLTKFLQPPKLVNGINL